MSNAIKEYHFHQRIIQVVFIHHRFMQ